jgi:uncharacterized protein (TIGR02186 family)
MRPLLLFLRRAALATVIAITALLLPGPDLRAQALVADLTNHLVGITTGFTGTSVVLFGATDGPGDVVVVVRGPPREISVRRKSRVGPIWANTQSARFPDVPSYYAVASSRPLEEIVAPAARQLYEIGLDNLRLGARKERPRMDEFRAALIRTQQREGLFGQEVGKINFLGERLFRTTINLPANVPTGTYAVQVFLVRDRDVVTGQTTPLIISKVGVDAELYDFADRRAALYGFVAVFTAMMAGWLASLPFRNA